MSSPTGEHQGTENFRRLNCPGVPHTEKSPSKNQEAYKLGVNSTLVTGFHLEKSFKNETRDKQDSQIHLVTSVGKTHQGESTSVLWVNSFADNIHCVHADDPLGHMTPSLD